MKRTLRPNAKLLTGTILMLLSVLTCFGVSAMTLEEARDMATERYPLTRDYDLIEQTAQFTVANAAKAWLPQVGVGAQATWQTAVASYPEVLNKFLEMQGIEMKGMSKFQYKASVDVTQTIWDGGRIRAMQQTARADAREQQANNEVDLYRLRGSVDQVYFSILMLEQQRDALSAAIEMLDANSAKVESLLRNGVAMQSDADAVRVEMLSTRQQLASVDASITAYREVLALYTGAPKDATLEMPAEFAVPHGNDFSERPEERLLNARMSLLDARRNEVNKSVMPTIGAFAQGFFGYPGLNYMEAMLKRDPTFNAMVGVKLSWDVSSLYTKRNKLKTIDMQRERIAVAREVFEFNSDLQATQQRLQLDKLRKISEEDREIVELRGRVRRASEAKLREGIIDSTDLLMRITEEKNAIIAANSHRIEYLMYLYQLNNTLGR